MFRWPRSPAADCILDQHCTAWSSKQTPSQFESGKQKAKRKITKRDTPMQQKVQIVLDSTPCQEQAVTTEDFAKANAVMTPSRVQRASSG